MLNPDVDVFESNRMGGVFRTQLTIGLLSGNAHSLKQKDLCKVRIDVVKIRLLNFTNSFEKKKS